jgi:hypothetical protein
MRDIDKLTVGAAAEPTLLKVKVDAVIASRVLRDYLRELCNEVFNSH